ncbi:di-trans,poly-cis-decaprenylcistransferase [Aurantimonas sp. 22II-16-19i]|uniref:di-trans,poly-cis-decaprenylcistransferase n=1 Tax=Aurantimonas sp. 22II-16-19i TaxID=1317114 RepID=UPI0009F7D842|nr:di-trans,poly-cis-decaprenylcistransferase [Aurantimonas sp. 22II-16-19i]ORE99048.1 undecaprenyl pyrophosphate synthase [Aurantimonas sp. 22II-16-19i]
MQSNLPNLHLGIIMDGNGRWATARGLPRGKGHEAGVSAIRPIVEAAPDHGIGTLTLYAFSSDNWRRPETEVAGLMALMQGYLGDETSAFARQGIRLSVVGRRDRIGPKLARLIARSEAETAKGQRLHLRIAFDYSARERLLAAAREGHGAMTERAFARLVTGDGAPDLDLLLRTGGEKRLSDFLLWESAYAELFFTGRMWPDFSPADLAGVMREFSRRQRRFGGLAGPAAAAPGLTRAA